MNNKSQTPVEENGTSEEAIKLQIEQNQVIQGMMDERFSRSELPPDLYSVIKDGIINYSSSLSLPEEKTTPIQRNYGSKSAVEEKAIHEMQVSAFKKAPQTKISCDKDKAKPDTILDDELIKLQSEQNRLSLDAVEDLIQHLPEDISNKVLYSLRENVVAICSPHEERLGKSAKSLSHDTSSQSMTSIGKRESLQKVTEEESIDKYEMDKNVNLLELQMTQANLINIESVIPKEISESLSSEMNEALKLSLSHNIQVLSNPRTNNSDTAIVIGGNAVLSTKHFEI